jgi:hypothetical protein
MAVARIVGSIGAKLASGAFAFPSTEFPENRDFLNSLFSRLSRSSGARSSNKFKDLQ